MDPKRFTPREPAQKMAAPEKASDAPTAPDQSAHPQVPKTPELPAIPDPVATTGAMLRDHMRSITPHHEDQQLRALCQEYPWLRARLKDPPK